MEKEYSGCVKGLERILDVDVDDTPLTLSHDNSQLDSWIVNRVVCPKIKKKYLTNTKASIPNCKFNFFWDAHLPVSRLELTIILEGAVDDEFFKVIIPQGTTTSTQDNNVDTSSHISKRDVNPFREYHHLLCERLETSDTTFKALTRELYSKGIIDQRTRIKVLDDGNQKGSDTLLDIVALKAEQEPRFEEVALNVMKKQEYLRDVVEKMAISSL